MNLLNELSLRNMSINECSKKTGIPYGALYPIIHGQVELENCKYSTLLKLSNFFGSSIEDLFSSFSDFTLYWKDEKIADVVLSNDRVLVTRYSENPVKQLFYKDELTYYELGEILLWRCWDKNRENIEKYLYTLGLSEFNPYKICRLTHGVMYQDKIWFKFAGENLTWADVKCC